VSYATQAAREQVLWQGFKLLRTLGYRFTDVHSFRETHLKALAHQWEERGLSPSRIQNNISIFRTFSGWIGKSGMIRASHHYVSSPELVSRQTKTRTDKTWSGRGINVQAKIAEVAQIDKRVAAALQLVAAFGLRPKEASLLRVHQADQQAYLDVNRGTKGARDRVVAIDNDTQRQALEHARSLVAGKKDSLILPEKTLKQWQNHFYTVCRQAGISRENGITAHGLRHERLNEIYQEITGVSSPIKGQQPGSVSKEDDAIARQAVAETAGHSRAAIASAYLG
jgi:integrase